MLNRQTIPWMALLLWALSLPCLSAQTVHIEGTVHDATGAVIVKASVVLNSGSYHAGHRNRLQWTLPLRGGSGKLGNDHDQS